ncbi:hypothetical protein [Lysinibacillus sphaericus]|uniref:hypothetical protein n=1 Tax=Lysinibacillus sphaericus TaxID=1421 RepID=UPI003CFE0D1B
MSRGKKILFLCNRDALKNETIEDVETTFAFNVDVFTYQHIEQSIRNNVKTSDAFITDYDYICCDEFHHVTEIYNRYTDLSFVWVYNHPSKKIYMSATATSIFNQFIEEDHVTEDNYYYIPKSYDYVDKFYFYKNKQDTEQIIRDKLHNTEDKIMFFSGSMNYALEIYNKFKNDALFFCSKHTKNTEAKEILKEQGYPIKNETFNSRLLVSTTALDVGVNLYDKSIKHIITSVYDWSQSIQCIGRKRILDDTDRCNIYIRNYNIGVLNLFDKAKELEELELFKWDRKEFNRKYISDRTYHNDFIYFDEATKDFKVNELAHLKLKQYQKEIYIMKDIEVKFKGKQMKGMGYKRFMMNKLGIEYGQTMNYEAVQQEQKEQSLVEYLEANVGVELYKEQREELIHKVGLKDNSNRIQRSISLLNEYLKENKISYLIVSKTTKTKIDGQRKSVRYWTIIDNITR